MNDLYLYWWSVSVQFVLFFPLLSTSSSLYFPSLNYLRMWTDISLLSFSFSTKRKRRRRTSSRFSHRSTFISRSLPSPLFTTMGDSPWEIGAKNVIGILSLLLSVDLCPIKYSKWKTFLLVLSQEKCKRKRNATMKPRIEHRRKRIVFNVTESIADECSVAFWKMDKQRAESVRWQRTLTHIHDDLSSVNPNSSNMFGGEKRGINRSFSTDRRWEQYSTGNKIWRE